MKVKSMRLIRFVFSALEDHWSDEHDIIVSPTATIEEWKQFHSTLSDVAYPSYTLHGVAVVDGHNGEVEFEQRERDGEFYIEFNGGFPQSDWTFTLTRSDAQELLDYISDMMDPKPTIDRLSTYFNVSENPGV